MGGSEWSYSLVVKHPENQWKYLFRTVFHEDKHFRLYLSSLLWIGCFLVIYIYHYYDSYRNILYSLRYDSYSCCIWPDSSPCRYLICQYDGTCSIRILRESLWSVVHGLQDSVWFWNSIQKDVFSGFTEGFFSSKG